MKVPFTIAHDVEHAGLRDYRAPIDPPSREWPSDRCVFWRLLAFVLLIACVVLGSYVLVGGVR